MSKSQKAQDNCHTPKPPTHDDCDDCTATFTSLNAESSFVNELQVGEDVLLENEGGAISPAPSFTVAFDCDDETTSFNLINNNGDDLEDDDLVQVTVQGSNQVIFSGKDTELSFELLKILSDDGELNLVLSFEDDANGHVDYNDMIVLVDIDCDDDKDHDKMKCNAGRGNGPELVDGVDCDPGNSGGRNNGGDYAGMPDHHGLLAA